MIFNTVLPSDLPYPGYDRGTYRERRLTSNLSGLVDFESILLQVPWGMVQIEDTIWIAQAGSATVQSYFLNGQPREYQFALIDPDGNPSQPTGIAYQIGNGYPIRLGPLEQPAALLVVSLSGQLYGYNAQLDPFAAVVLADYSVAGSVFTGLCLADDQRLHIADFQNGEVISLNPDLSPILYQNAAFLDQDFRDPIPPEFHPYNITQVGELFYVCYAELQERPGGYAQFGFGKGFISVFDRDGAFRRRFASRDLLNAPWGITRAPFGWGYPSGTILVGCAGSGLIIAYDLEGTCLGPIVDPALNGIVLGELREIITLTVRERSILWCGSADFLRQGLLGVVLPCEGPSF